MKINATEIDHLELWDGKNPETRTSLYGVPFTKEKGKKQIPAARWMVPGSRGKHVSFFTRYQMYKMSGKGLVGIVQTKMNNTEPEAFLWRPGEEKPVFMGQYLWFQYSNKKIIELMERHFADDPVDVRPDSPTPLAEQGERRNFRAVRLCCRALCSEVK